MSSTPSTPGIALAGKWTPRGFLERFRRTICGPADLMLALRIGLFIWSAPRQLDRQSLPGFLDRKNRRRWIGSPPSVERIQRLRDPWLRLGPLRARNTCYLRALTLFHFLDTGLGDLRLHLGIEPAGPSGHRLRGHAWVSLDGCPLETPEPVRLGRVLPIYEHRARPWV